jgi:hypothetical protein
MLGTNVLLEKQEEKYLLDILSCLGIAESLEITVKKELPKLRSLYTSLEL